MNEMIERVARAFCAGQHIDPEQWGLFVNHATLALQAIREPTAMQILRGQREVDSAGLKIAMVSPHDIYQAMIDESLK